MTLLPAGASPQRASRGEHVCILASARVPGGKSNQGTDPSHQPQCDGPHVLYGLPTVYLIPTEVLLTTLAFSRRWERERHVRPDQGGAARQLICRHPRGPGVGEILDLYK
jgi:hypothetical protein